MEAPGTARTCGYRATAMAETVVVTVLACDLVESTELMSRVGDDVADTIRREVFAAWRATIEREGGVVVKTIGDAVMAVFRSSAAQACATAVALHDVSADPGTGKLLPIRVGIAHGEAATEGGDWFGTPVVEAFRLCARAEPGEILLSAVARRVVGTRGNYEFVDVGSLSLKGLPERVPTFALARTGGPQPRPQRRRRHPFAWIAAVLAVCGVIAVAVIAHADSGTSGTHTSAAPVNAGPLGYTPRLESRPCTAAENNGDMSITCATLVVPEDRAHPRGHLVRLSVVRAPADKAQALPEINVGISAPPGGIDLRSVADQWLLAIRGDAGSEPSLSCNIASENAARRLGLDSQAAAHLLYAELDTCRAKLVARGVDLEKYGPNDVADDMRDLAIAAHLSRVDLRVFADGALPAYSLLRRSPSLVHAMTLNSPATLDSYGFAPVGIADAALRDYGRYCAADQACKSIAPNFVAGVETLRAEWSALPTRLAVTAPDGSKVGVLMTGDRLMEGIWLAMHDNGAYPAIAGAVASHNASLIGAYLALRHLGSGPVDPDVRSTVWRCQTGAGVPTALETDRRTFPQWQPIIDTNGFAQCQRWGIHPQADYRAPVVSTTPALVIDGDREPEAENIALLHGELAASQLITLKGLASGDAGSWPPCVPQLRRAFMLQPTKQVDSQTCGESTRRLSYIAIPDTVP